MSGPGGQPPIGTGTGGTPGAAISGVGGEVYTGPTSFSAELLESVQEIPLPGISFTVKALDNATGQPLGFETVPDSNSQIFFENLPAGPVAFLVVGQESMSIDTYQFNLDANDKNETVWVVALSSVTSAPSLANIVLNPEKGVAAGAIYWVDGAGVEWPVGCATVTIDDGVGDIRYFAKNNMPTTDVFRDDAPDQEVRTSTNSINGKYYIGNANPGSRTVSATLLNGQSLGTTTLLVTAGKDSSDGQYAISISNIYVQGDANPTPADCI